MSTSRSDEKPPATKKEPPPTVAGVGVAGLFKRAVEAHAEKNTPVAAGVQLTTCSHCGAPRQRAELVCHFCEEKL